MLAHYLNDALPSNHCLTTLNSHISVTTSEKAMAKGYELSPSRMGGPRTSFALVAFMGHDTGKHQQSPPRTSPSMGGRHGYRQIRPSKALVMKSGRRPGIFLPSNIPRANDPLGQDRKTLRHQHRQHNRAPPRSGDNYTALVKK